MGEVEHKTSSCTSGYLNYNIMMPIKLYSLEFKFKEKYENIYLYITCKIIFLVFYINIIR
jgi:hypothetical protein